MIIHSDNLNELFAAVAKAQGEIKDPPFDMINPHFKSKFASLNAGLAEIRPIFSKHGLSITQWPSMNEKGHCVVTIIGHSSGQWIKSEMNLLLQKQDMQGIGAALTYAKRQMAFAAAGISGEDDDDGNSVSKPPSQSVQKQNAQPVSQPQKPQNHAPHSVAGSELSEAQIKRLWAMTKALGWSIEDTFTSLKQQFSKEKPELLTKEEYTIFTSKLQVEIDRSKK